MSAFFIADISRRRANHARDGVLLHVFGHVEPHHGALVIEKKFGQRARRFSLSDTGRAEKNERANWSIRVLQTRAGTTNRISNRGQRFVLANYALFQLGFERAGRRFETRGESRGGWIEYEDAPAEHGISGAGTVHHVAWASTMEDEEAWQKRVAEAGARPTPIIDRFWFLSIYFREPNGVLFEIATLGPGFAADEDPEHLGEKLVLPPAFEHMRSEVEPILTPLPNPREAWTRS